MVYIEFVDIRSDRSRTLGPFPFVQVTYSDVRVGEDGEQFIATHHNGEWFTPDDNQSWSDFIVSHHT